MKRGASLFYYFCTHPQESTNDFMHNYIKIMHGINSISDTPELLSNEDKWSDKEWKIMEITSTRKLKFSNHTSLEHYNPGATDLAIAPNLQCRSLQSCQRLELHAVVCKANVKSDRWGRGEEDKEEKFMDFTT